MDLKKIIYTVEDGIGVITMNCMKNLNAIDEEMAEEILQALNAAENDMNVKVIVLRGSEKAFSAGGDIDYFYNLIQSGEDVNIDSLIEKVDKVALKLKQIGKIVITSVSGAAAGAGISLAIGGDFLICSDNSKFILAFVNLGLVPDTGATYLLTKSIGATRTLELAATGRPVGAEEMKSLGLAYKVVPKDGLEQETMKFAKTLSKGPLLAYKNIKKQIYDASYSDFEKWVKKTESSTQHECASSNDFKEGVVAFKEKRKAEFKGN